MVFCLGATTGCAGGRLTVFDPLARSMSRQSADSGQSSVDRSNIHSAERAFRRAIDLDRRNAEAHAGLARILAARGDDVGAAESYRSAVKFAPANPAYAEELGECLGRRACRSLDRRTLSSGSMRAFRLARSLSPASASLALKHGHWARRMQLYAEALAALGDAVKLSPESAEAHRELAAVYEAIGDGASARRESSMAAKLAGDVTGTSEQTASVGDVED